MKLKDIDYTYNVYVPKELQDIFDSNMKLILKRLDGELTKEQIKRYFKHKIEYHIIENISDW